MELTCFRIRAVIVRPVYSHAGGEVPGLGGHVEAEGDAHEAQKTAVGDLEVGHRSLTGEVVNNSMLSYE